MTLQSGQNNADILLRQVGLAGLVADVFNQLVNGEGSGPNGTTSLFAQRFDSLADPLGQEFQPGAAQERDQRMPAAAVLGDNGFVVAWQEGNQSNGQTEIRAQAYDLFGAATGGEILVTAPDSGLRTNPSIAGMPDDAFVVTWQSFGQDASGWEVFVRHFGADGVAL